MSVPLLFSWSARICRLCSARPAGKKRSLHLHKPTKRPSDFHPLPPFSLLPRICRSPPLPLVNTNVRSLRASALTDFSVPIIQNDNQVASFAITATSGNSTVLSTSITRESSSQTLRGSPHIIPTSAIGSSTVASSDTSPPNDTPIAAQYSSTTMSLQASAIFAIVLSGAALLAAILCLAFCLWRRSPPAPPSVSKARYLRKRRPSRSMSDAWTTIEPVVSPDYIGGLTATRHPPKEESSPVAPKPPSQRGLSGFRIPRKAPPRLPSWALPTPQDIPEIRSPEPFRLMPDSFLVRQIPSTPDQYPLASANLISFGARETQPTPYQLAPNSSSQASSPSPDRAHPNLTTLRAPALSLSNSHPPRGAKILSVFPMPPREHPSQTA